MKWLIITVNFKPLHSLFIHYIVRPEPKKKKKKRAPDQFAHLYSLMREYGQGILDMGSDNDALLISK